MALQTPSPTLYVSNLETKTKKPELRSALYALFNPYGSLLDIVAKKNDGGRGQAFVVFADQAAATSAMRGLTGEHFYGKALNITYAKSKSNATIAREDPTRSKDAEALRAAKLVVSRAQGEYEALEKEREEQEAGLGKRALEDGEEGEGGSASKKVKRETEDDEEEMEIEMEDDEDALPKANGAAAGVTVICSNLPPEASENILGALYGQYPGYTKAAAFSGSLPSSHPSPNAGAKSFRVTFASAEQASTAAAATKDYLMQPGWAMGVSVE